MRQWTMTAVQIVHQFGKKVIFKAIFLIINILKHFRNRHSGGSTLGKAARMKLSCLISSNKIMSLINFQSVPFKLDSGRHTVEPQLEGQPSSQFASPLKGGQQAGNHYLGVDLRKSKHTCTHCITLK